MLRTTAIAPGGRYVAFATVEGDALLRAEVTSLRRHRDSAEKFAVFLTRLRAVLDEDRPAILAVEALTPFRATTNARAQVARVAAEANDRGLRIELLDLRQCGESLGGCGRWVEGQAILRDLYPDIAGAVDARRRRALVAATAVALAAGAQTNSEPTAL